MIPKYPTIKDIKSLLRNNLIKPVRLNVRKAFIIGSEAKGNATNGSDLDAAIVISPIKGKTSIQYTENYHSYFTKEYEKPHWNGRCIDFQFFYETDKELISYEKIEL